MKKGSRIYCAGKFTTRKWQDQSGADKYSTRIKMHDMQMLDSKGGDTRGQQGSGDTPTAPRGEDAEGFDLDIPF